MNQVMMTSIVKFVIIICESLTDTVLPITFNRQCLPSIVSPWPVPFGLMARYGIRIYLRWHDGEKVWQFITITPGQSMYGGDDAIRRLSPNVGQLSIAAPVIRPRCRLCLTSEQEGEWETSN